VQHVHPVQHIRGPDLVRAPRRLDLRLVEYCLLEPQPVVDPVALQREPGAVVRRRGIAGLAVRIGGVGVVGLRRVAVFGYEGHQDSVSVPSLAFSPWPSWYSVISSELRFTVTVATVAPSASAIPITTPAMAPWVMRSWRGSGVSPTRNGSRPRSQSSTPSSIAASTAGSPPST